MILEIWLLLAAISITTLIYGIVFAKTADITTGKVNVLMLSFIFQIFTAISSFSIEKIGFTGGNAVTKTITTVPIAVLFFALSLYSLFLIFIYTFESIKQ